MGGGEAPGRLNGTGGEIAPVRFPLAIDVMKAGHSVWIAIPVKKPAMGGARPPLPLNGVGLRAKLLPGWTSRGQMDCPTWAMAVLIGPLLPIPMLLSTVVI